MKAIKFIFLLLLVFCSCVSEKKRAKICSTCPVISTVWDSVVYNETVIQRDSLIQLPADSSYFKLWLECKEGKVIVKKEVSKDGIKSKNTYALKDNLLTSKCEVDSSYVALKWNEKNRSKEKITNKDNTKIIEVPVKLNFRQKVFIAVGKLVIGILVIVLGIVAFRLAFKLF